MPGPVLSERDLAVLRSFARRIDPSDAGAHNNLGVLYYQKGLIEDAIAEFVRALELDPRMQVAQSNLDIAYRESGHYDRRVTELRERVRRVDERTHVLPASARDHARSGPCVRARSSSILALSCSICCGTGFRLSVRRRRSTSASCSREFASATSRRS